MRTASKAVRVSKGNEDERRWRQTLQTFGDPRRSQGLEIGLLVLRTFTSERPTMGIADIADKLKLSRSTSHRYVVTLHAYGLVEQDAKRKYRLGARAQNVGMSMLNATGLPPLCVPFLEDLRDQLGYTISLAILDRDSILYAARARSHRKGQYAADDDRQVGSRVPATLTAMGKVLVAGLPDAEREAWIDTTMPTPGSSRSVTAKKRFRAELDQVRRLGYAVNNRELTSKTVAIAVPIRQGEHVNVALAAVANAQTIGIKMLTRQCLDALRATADELAEHVRYDRRAKW